MLEAIIIGIVLGLEMMVIDGCSLLDDFVVLVWTIKILM
jgi:hypothetical protein